MRTGAKPVLVDIEDEYWTTDPNSVKRRISDKTKAVLLVHTYGQPCDMDAILELSKDRGLYVIEDCAQAIGGKYRGRPLGSMGDAAIFSSNVDKPITTGSGGIVYTKDKGLAGELAKFSATLPQPTSSERIYVARKIAAAYMFSHPSLVQAMRKVLRVRNRVAAEQVARNQASTMSLANSLIIKSMTREAALFGLNQVGNIAPLANKRYENAQYLAKGLEGLTGIELPKERENCIHAFTAYTIRLAGGRPAEARQRLKSAFAKNGIYAGNRIWPAALHQDPDYRRLTGTDDGGVYPVTEKFVDSFINLPVHPVLRKRDLDDIAETIREAV
jgi:perosamine synthetase